MPVAIPLAHARRVRRRLLSTLASGRSLAVSVALLSVIGAGSGCAGGSAAPPATRPAPHARTEPSPRPAAVPDARSRQLPNDVHWVRGSAEYQALVRQVYATATARIEQLAAGRAPGTWGVSVDTDETLLSNIEYQRQLTLADATHDEASWSAWVRRREATPLPGAIPFLDRVRALGGRIVVVTNRRQSVCPETEDGLRKFGVPFDLLLCLRPGESSQKEPRWQAVETGTAAPGWPAIDLLLWVGDNIGDFPDLAQDARHDPAALALFGDRYFVLPNPIYGSWEANPED